MAKDNLGLLDLCLSIVVSRMKERLREKSSEFEASMDYIVTSRIAWAVKGNPISKSSNKSNSREAETGQWLKASSHKPDDLNLIPRPYIEKERAKLPSDVHMHAACMPVHTHTPIPIKQ